MKFGRSIACLAVQAPSVPCACTHARPPRGITSRPTPASSRLALLVVEALLFRASIGEECLHMRVSDGVRGDDQAQDFGAAAPTRYTDGSLFDKESSLGAQPGPFARAASPTWSYGAA